MSLKVVFILNTESSFFFNWLAKRARSLNHTWPAKRKSKGEHDPLAEEGEVRLFFRDYAPVYRRDSLAIEAHYVFPYKNEDNERIFSPVTLIQFESTPLSEKRCEIVARCLYEPANELFLGLLREITERWPEADQAVTKTQKRGKLGTHGSTLDRVSEARALVEKGIPKTKACRRAGIDPRTYDRYVVCFVNFGEDK